MLPTFSIKTYYVGAMMMYSNSNEHPKHKFLWKTDKIVFQFSPSMHLLVLNVTASQIQNLLTCILKPSLGYYGTFTFCRLDTFMMFFNKRSNRNFVKNCCKLLKGNLLPNQEISSNACWEFRINIHHLEVFLHSMATSFEF